ncbi:hypothetical protein ACQJBY_031760 [Aegilops geniculata]
MGAREAIGNAVGGEESATGVRGRMGSVRGMIGGAVGRAIAGTATTRRAGRGATARRAATRHGECGGAFLSRALCLRLLRKDDAGEDGVEGKALVAEDDADGVKPLVKSMKELGGEIHLGNGTIDVSESVGEEFEATSVLRHREVTLFEIAVLAVEDHETGVAIGEEEIFDFVPEGVGGGGADDVIAHGVREGGINPQNDMGIELKVRGRSVGRWRMVEEEGDAVANEDHQKEGFSTCDNCDPRD